MNRRQLCLAGIAGVTATLGLLAQAQAQAQAQAWPDRPVKWVLSQPAGSGPDNVARLLSERLSKAWGQAVVIDNKPGGQNTIGAQAAARSAPDGYTFYFATTAALVTNAYLFKQLPYDPLKDFVPVGFVAKSPFAVLVEANSPIKSIEDLIERAKAAPGKVTMGNEGPRTFSGMIARLLNARAKVETNLVSSPRWAWRCKTRSAATSTPWWPTWPPPPRWHARVGCACWPSLPPSASRGGTRCRRWLSCCPASR